MNEETKLILAELAKANNGLAEIKEDVAVLKQDVSGLKEHVSALRLDMEEQKHISAGLDRRTLRMEVMMENEFRTNLSIVAEGHLDLSRKLSEALRVNQERELYLVRFNRLESDVKDLKEFTGMV